MEHFIPSYGFWEEDFSNFTQLETVIGLGVHIEFIISTNK